MDKNCLEYGNWKDGTYTETAKGENGKCDVTVEIVDGIKYAVTRYLGKASK